MTFYSMCTTTVSIPSIVSQRVTQETPTNSMAIPTRAPRYSQPLPTTQPPALVAGRNGAGWTQSEYWRFLFCIFSLSTFCFLCNPVTQTLPTLGYTIPKVQLTLPKGVTTVTTKRNMYLSRARTVHQSKTNKYCFPHDRAHKNIHGANKWVTGAFSHSRGCTEAIA